MSAYRRWERYFYWLGHYLLLVERRLLFRAHQLANSIHRLWHKVNQLEEVMEKLGDEEAIKRYEKYLREQGAFHLADRVNEELTHFYSELNELHKEE